MKILFGILKIFFGVLVLILIVTFFLPSKVHVERKSLIKGSSEVVYGLINNVKEWEKWSPWHRIDPKMKIEYGNITEGKGAFYAWTSEHKDVGNGKMTISDARPSEYLKTQMDFMENGKADGEFFLQPAENGTEVKWTMDSDMGMNPIAKIVGLFLDKWVGSDYEKGLHYLDSVAQITKPEEFTMNIEMGKVAACKVLLIKGTAKESEIGKVLGEIYGNLTGIIGQNSLTMTGAPLAIYNEPVNGVFTFEAGLPIDKKPSKALPANVMYRELPDYESLICHFSGPYDKTAAAYPALQKAMEEKGKSPVSKPFEIYVSDPTLAKTPLDIKTDICWPVK
jgi:effector-binding domain-containing protein